MLNKYSVIIIDEAHERKLNTDILIGFLSRVVRFRALKSLKMIERDVNNDVKVFPLRLVIMSATLKINDFIDNQILFWENPPLIRIKV